MKILIVSGIYPPEIGGAATYSKNLLLDLPKKGFDVHILTLGNFRNTELITYISRRRSYLQRTLSIKRFIEKNKFDIIYMQDPLGVGFGVALAKTTAKKYIRVAGDNAWEISRDILGIKESIDNFQNKQYGIKITLMKLIQRFVVKRCNRIITPSKYLKKLVIGWGVKPSKIKVIYNAVKLNTKLKNDKIKLRKKLKIVDKTIITVTRLAPWKGVDLLIDIFKDRKEHLIIIGDGLLLKKYRRLTKNIDNIKVVGRLKNDQVVEYMQAADGFILNSGYEGLPHVVIEAFQSGCPVLLSDVCGNPEIVENNFNGLLFRYNNKKSIIKALDSLNKAEKFVKNAKKSLEKFNWENMIKQLIKELKGIKETK